MIQIKDLHVSFGVQPLFDGFSCTISKSDRIGLVGRNGSGKSTLLKIIAQHQKPDDGLVQKNGTVRIGYVPQDLVLSSKRNVIDEAISCCYFDVTEEQALRAEAKKILAGLGFCEYRFEQSVSELSVGWKMRLVLAQSLLQKADFYLFDEPTNHLDIVAKEWFFDFIKDADFGFMLVCHDKYFLDRLCTKILEIDQQNCFAYNGGYSKYVEQKEHRLTTLKAAYENQKKDIARKKSTIDRFRAKASKAKMVKKMERELEKIDCIEIPQSQKDIHFTFADTQPSGKVVLDIKDLSYAYDLQPVFKNVSCTVTRNDRIAIIAPNGTGKTTLFNVISGKFPVQNGKLEFGYRVHPAYFEQDHVNSLDLEKSIFDTVSDRTEKIPTSTIQNMLGCFLFSGETIEKKIKVLSGGEKNRVSMVVTLLQHANFLMLDEPTNHLDIQSKEILLRALKAYKGTILFVSHDHDFVNELATKVLSLTPNGANCFCGNYEDYLYHQKMIKSDAQKPIVSQKKDNKEACSKQEYENRKIIGRLESKIHKLEKKIEELTCKLEQYSYGTNEFHDTYTRVKKHQDELEQVMKEWEQMHEDMS